VLRQTLQPSYLVFQNYQFNALGCEAPAESCGGYAPVNSSTPVPYQVYYEGSHNLAASTTLVAIFVSPTGKPFPGKELFLYFRKNSSIINCCGATSTVIPTFQIQVRNCTKTHYTYCFSRKGNECFDKEAATNCTTIGPTYNSIGDSSGIWIENPGSHTFHVYLSVTDIYSQCTSCGNSNEADFYPGGIELQY
jgi:hypothetical protein